MTTTFLVATAVPDASVSAPQRSGSSVLGGSLLDHVRDFWYNKLRCQQFASDVQSVLSETSRYTSALLLVCCVKNEGRFGVVKRLHTLFCGSEGFFAQSALI